MTAIRGPGGPKGPKGTKSPTRSGPKAGKASGGGKSASGSAGASAKVSLSKDVKLMEEVKASLDAVPEVNVSRVAELKEFVNSGNYEPNLDMVANGLIEEAILRSLQ